MSPRSCAKWPLSLSMLLFLWVVLWDGGVISQFKRDEQTAQEVQKVNILSPAVEGVGVVIDKSVNQVLPFDISTQSQLVKSEQDCYRSCEKEKDKLLKIGMNEADLGYAWYTFHSCKNHCPEEAYHKTQERQRAPAGSAIEHIRSR